MDEARYGVSELADEAGVSVRTVRYYISEGLLPPPVTAGSRSYYDEEHLQRLRLIGRLKEAFLPLKEIRRHLAELDGSELHDLINEEIDRATGEIADAKQEIERAKADVKSEVQRAKSDLKRELDQLKATFSAPGFPFSSAEEAPPPDYSAPPTPDRIADPTRQRKESAADYINKVLGRSAPGRGPKPPLPPVPPPVLRPHPPAAPGDAVSWRRIRIGDDAELLIKETAYARKRDKIDWLVDWARKVLG